MCRSCVTRCALMTFDPKSSLWSITIVNNIATYIVEYTRVLRNATHLEIFWIPEKWFWALTVNTSQIVELHYLFDNFNIIFTTSENLFANCCFCLAKLLHQLEQCGVEVEQKGRSRYITYSISARAFIICAVPHQVLIEESRNAFPSSSLKLFLVAVLEIKWGYCKCSLFLPSKWDMIGNTIWSVCYYSSNRSHFSKLRVSLLLSQVATSIKDWRAFQSLSFCIFGIGF